MSTSRLPGKVPGLHRPRGPRLPQLLPQRATALPDDQKAAGDHRGAAEIRRSSHGSVRFLHVDCPMEVWLLSSVNVGLTYYITVVISSERGYNLI